jgi:hypothetical protein
MEAPWVLVHVLTDTLPSVENGHCAGPWKVHALRTVAPAYADQFLFQGTGVTTKVRFQIPQFRLDNPPFHVIPQLWIASLHSLLLQFRQHRDASLQSLRNMTHHDLLRARAGQPNSDEPAEFVTLIARRWEDGSKSLNSGSQLDHEPTLPGTTVGAVPLGYWELAPSLLPDSRTPGDPFRGQ